MVNNPIAMMKLVVKFPKSPATKGLIDIPVIYNAREYPIIEDEVFEFVDKAYTVFRIKCSRLSEANPSNIRPENAIYIFRVYTESL